jgi:hypothetical protein
VRVPFGFGGRKPKAESRTGAHETHDALAVSELRSRAIEKKGGRAAVRCSCGFRQGRPAVVRGRGAR